MRRSSTSWMWAEACELLAQAERLHRQFFQLASAAPGAAPAWEAPVDVFEHGAEVIVMVALPGVEPEAIRITLDGALLRVSGERLLSTVPRTAVIRRLEIPHGRLEGMVELPASGYELEEHAVANGCVRLRLRRR